MRKLPLPCVKDQSTRSKLGSPLKLQPAPPPPSEGSSSGINKLNRINRMNELRNLKRGSSKSKETTATVQVKASSKGWSRIRFRRGPGSCGGTWSSPNTASQPPTQSPSYTRAWGCPCTTQGEPSQIRTLALILSLSYCHSLNAFCDFETHTVTLFLGLVGL